MAKPITITGKNQGVQGARNVSYNYSPTLTSYYVNTNKIINKKKKMSGTIDIRKLCARPRSDHFTPTIRGIPSSISGLQQFMLRTIVRTKTQSTNHCDYQSEPSWSIYHVDGDNNVTIRVATS